MITLISRERECCQIYYTLRSNLTLNLSNSKRDQINWSANIFWTIEERFPSWGIWSHLLLNRSWVKIDLDWFQSWVVTIEAMLYKTKLTPLKLFHHKFIWFQLQFLIIHQAHCNQFEKNLMRNNLFFIALFFLEILLKFIKKYL